MGYLTCWIKTLGMWKRSLYHGLQEKKLGRLNEFLHHEVTVNDFRDFVENVVSSNVHVPQSVKRAKNIIDTIVISSVEAELGFSRMNIIHTDKRGRLSVKNVANLIELLEYLGGLEIEA